MHTHTDIAIETFLKGISAPDGTIDLSSLKKLPGGGTHDIYRSEKHPELLLKIMRRTIGNDSADLANFLQKVDGQYSALYETFEPSRCIIEKRSIQAIKSSDAQSQQKAIVSVVPFDSCFESKEKFGFNVAPIEMDGILIDSKKYLYRMTNRSLLGDYEAPSPYIMRNYPQLNKNFETLFKQLDTDESLVLAMREFLTKYKSFYKKSGILLDTIGLDNVVFYKADNVWQFKLGSVIKHDTGALTKRMLDELIKNPAVVNQSFEAMTALCLMPACIRALNACAKKVGMEKIIDDINIDERTSAALAKMHVQLGKSHQIFNHAEHGEFATALKLYRQYTSDEKSEDTRLRDTMGTLYWDFIKKGGKEASRNEVETYLKILSDERNKFPEFRKKIAAEAIDGLQNKLRSIEDKKTETPNKSASSQKLKFFDAHTKTTQESDKQYVARQERQKGRAKKP